MESRISVNGVVTRSEDARVPALDRGFLYGDSVYEVIWWHRGAPIQADDHFDRLERSAASVYLDLAHPRSAWFEAIERTVEASGATVDDDAYVRLVVTRGCGALGLSPDPTARPNVVVYVTPATRPAPEATVSLAIVARERVGRRAVDPAAKTGNYLNNVLALCEARALGADDAVMCNADGWLTEATTSNVYLVERGLLATPALDLGLLEGTTRRRVLALARDLGLAVEETALRPERLRAADEVLLSSSVRGLIGVRSIDGEPLPSPVPGPWTRRLREAFDRRADEEALAYRASRDVTSR